MLSSSSNSTLILSHISDILASMGIFTDTELRTNLFVLLRLIGDRDEQTKNLVQSAYSSMSDKVDRYAIYNTMSSAYTSALTARI